MNKMKKFQLFVINFLMIAIVLFLQTEIKATETTQTKTYGDYKYCYNEEYDGIEILDYTGKDRKVVVPETIDGVPVKVIGEWVFYSKKPAEENKTLREVVLPDTILEIKKFAFYECVNLRKVTMPKYLKKMGYSVFSNCFRLESVEIPQTLTRLSETVFSYTDIKEITIPANIVKIKGGAFCGCHKLEKVTFEEGSKLERISSSAFEDCDKLKEIHFPKSLLIFGEDAFRDCESLRTVTFEKDSRLKVISYYAFAECDSLEKITLPKNVKKIDSSAFRNCKSLKKIVFKGNVPAIKKNAFKGIRKNATFKVPAKYKSKYKKKLRSRSWYKKTMKIV